MEYRKGSRHIGTGTNAYIIYTTEEAEREAWSA
jgi:hypothetical protein